MNTLITKKSADLLPNELFTHILGYLPLSDLPNISRSSKNLYILTKNSYMTWARLILAKILDPFSDDQTSELSLITTKQQPGLFIDNLKPHQIFQNRAQIHNELNKFIGNYLSFEEKEILIEELFNVLQSPPPPKPCLKRDCQYFKTNTMFQNFLTEVHFQLNKRNYLKDMKCPLVESLVDEIQIQIEPSDSNLQELASKAWALCNNTDLILNNSFQKQIKQLDASFESDGQSDQGSKTSSTRSSLKGRANRQSKGRKTRQVKRRLNKSKTSSSSENFSEGEESSEIGGILLAIQGLQGKQDDASKLLELIYMMAQNYCHLVRSYMAGIQEPMMFLNEYNRLWENYVMITINFDETFGSLSDYAAEAYNHKFGYNNNENFSVWKLMIKAWTNEVFTKVSDCLAQILSSASHDLRNSNKKSSEDNYEAMKLIQEVYYSIGDLSYNESTVFFSDCATINPETPKAIFDQKILGNIKALYKQDELLVKNDSMGLKAIFEEDVKLIKKLFGEELKFHVLDLQAGLLKEELEGLFESGVDQAEFINVSFNTRGMNFGKIFENIQVPEEEQKKIQNDRQYQTRMVQAILGECAFFEDFIDLMTRVKEEIRVENIEASQKAMSLYEKGFYLTKDQKPKCSVAATQFEEINFNFQEIQVN